tara:strand:+ start:287 stop:691 length:405 start_codon:yes stop_codon:yes gene_type:complete
METKKTIRIMDGSRGIQLEVGKYKLSMGMSGFHYCSNKDTNSCYSDEVVTPSATSVEVALFDEDMKFLLPEQVAGWVEVSELPELIQALAQDDLPWAIRICGQAPEPKLCPCDNCGSLWPVEFAELSCPDCTGH